jgi:hypothetical protein
VSIFGLDAMALPESYTPLESIAVIKALDETGQVSLLIRSTDGLNTWEQIGMLDTAITVTREGLCQLRGRTRRWRRTNDRCPSSHPARRRCLVDLHRPRPPVIVAVVAAVLVLVAGVSQHATLVVAQVLRRVRRPL